MTDAIYVDGKPTGNPYVDSLLGGSQWVQEPGQPAIQHYAFQSGEDPMGKVWGESEPWTDIEKAAVRAAMSSWEAVANVKFVETNELDTADVWYWKNQNIDGAAYHEFPAYFTQPLAAVFAEYPAWPRPGAMETGAYFTMVMRHEIGHGLGLAHPHDGGYDVDGNVFPGVTPETPFGDGNNTQLNTIMSYNPAPDGFYPDQPFYGYCITPMALDVAAVQYLYGANMETGAGDDTYVLPTENVAGTGYSCIWDAAGTDTISAGETSLAVTIDLNEAPLTGPHAGGKLSSATGILGGFTIANGAVIENAVGGAGNDAITGNGADNVLTGRDSADSLDGAGGKDTLNGGRGNDSLNGGVGDDALSGGEGDDALTGAADNDSLEGGGGMDLLIGGMGNDVMSGGASSDTLFGGLGNDKLNGGDGADSLTGSLGNDALTGGAGKDRFIFNDPAVKSNADTIADFTAAEDKIVINNQYFAKLLDGALDEKNFHIGDAAQSAKDFIIFDQATGNLWYDADGRLAANAQQLICTLDVTGLTGTLTAGNLEII